MDRFFLFGCGEMGKIVLKSLLEFKKYQKQQITIVTRGSNKKFAKELAISFTSEPQIAPTDILFFALPPQAASFWLQKLHLQPSNFLMSIMAGYSTKSIEQFCPNTPIIRAMPNLLIQEKQGITAYFCNKNCTEKHKKNFLEIFQPMSELLEFYQEDKLDVCTAVFGSGVGFVFYLMKAYFETVQEMGFSQKDAKNITCNLFSGSSFFAQNSKSSFQQLVNQVCTKGGTTEKGILVFMENKVDKTIRECIIKTYKRSKEFSQG